jgi:hypothetical protein
MKERDYQSGAIKRTYTATFDSETTLDDKKEVWRFSPQIIPVLISMATSGAKSVVAAAILFVILLKTNFLPNQIPPGPLPIISLSLVFAAICYVAYQQVKLHMGVTYLLTSKFVVTKGRCYTYFIHIEEVDEVRIERIPFRDEVDVVIFGGTVAAADGLVRDRLRLRSVRDCHAFQVAFGERRRGLVDRDQGVSVLEG